MLEQPKDSEILVIHSLKDFKASLQYFLGAKSANILLQDLIDVGSNFQNDVC